MNKENSRPKLNPKTNFISKHKKEGSNILQESKSMGKDEQYKTYMKYLIATNSEYFHNKSKHESIQ